LRKHQGQARWAHDTSVSISPDQHLVSDITCLMEDQKVAISLKRFLLIQQCPPEWKSLDLYLFRDEAVVFYVGQSYFAFARVWEHLLTGFKGHSIVGRFVWFNWPKSMNFTIELFSSQSEQFFDVMNELNASERLLIQRWSPCFNISLNNQPTSLPDSYLPPNAPFRRRQGLNMLIHEAERAVKAEDTKLWLESI
jgi:hypothetical protein